MAFSPNVVSGATFSMRDDMSDSGFNGGSMRIASFEDGGPLMGTTGEIDAAENRSRFTTSIAPLKSTSTVTFQPLTAPPTS